MLVSLLLLPAAVGCNLHKLNAVASRLCAILSDFLNISPGSANSRLCMASSLMLQTMCSHNIASNVMSVQNYKILLKNEVQLHRWPVIH